MVPFSAAAFPSIVTDLLTASSLHIANLHLSNLLTTTKGERGSTSYEEVRKFDIVLAADIDEALRLTMLLLAVHHDSGTHWFASWGPLCSKLPRASLLQHHGTYFINRRTLSCFSCADPSQ